MTIEMRCNGTMHAKITDRGIEIKCKRRSCGAKPGVVVLHTFNPSTGEMIGTSRYSDPARQGDMSHATG